MFVERPSYDFLGFQSACEVFLQHLKSAENNSKEKFQIVVDSDLDGICSAAILYKFLQKYYPNIETVYSIHPGKQHGLSNDVVIDKNTTLVLCPDSTTNDTVRCKELKNKNIDVIVLDHHIIEHDNPYASVVNCMDGKYPNTPLCGTAVTWLFLYGFCTNCIAFFDEHHSFLLSMLDLVATATISDIMDVTNEDNMYFIQNGLKNIQSNTLRSFLEHSEVDLNDVTVEDIKFKLAPLVSAMIRMGNVSEKTLLFRAFIDDYEEFPYEKRGSFEIGSEPIYDRVVRLCKNAKSRQDRAKQKLLDECQIYEYPHILLVEYQADTSSTLTGLVANELANTYCKPCIVYRTFEERDENGEAWFSGSVRNYDGSPISNLKQLLSDIFQNDGKFNGHASAHGALLRATRLGDNAGFYADIIEEYINTHPSDESTTNIAVGDKVYQLDFTVPASCVTSDFVHNLHWFEHYSGQGFAPVTALVTGIKVSASNFRTIGKASNNWKIYDDGTDVTYVKFKIDKQADELIQKFDDVDWDSETRYGELYDDWDTEYVIDAVCTFGLNVFKGLVYPQCVVKDYVLRKIKREECDEDDIDFDF